MSTIERAEGRTGQPAGTPHNEEETRERLYGAKDSANVAPAEPSSGSKMVEWALYAVRLGYPVFPCRPNGKTPLVKGWEGVATTGEEQIRAWWERWPDANIGAAVGKGDVTVLDIDVKGGKTGIDSLEALEHGRDELPRKRTSTTPSGGFHIHMRGATTSSNGKLGAGLDVKSRGGYVLMPGSSVDGRPYKWRKLGDLRDCPTWFVELMAGPHEAASKSERAAEPAAGWDNPPDITRARHFLDQEAEPAIEGQGGDARTYGVACALRDMGLSPQIALELMAEVYNPRCQPSWPVDDGTNGCLRAKVDNAYRYAKGDAGGSSVLAAFADHPSEDGSPPALAHARGKPASTFANCLAVVEHLGLGLAFDDVRRRAVLRTESLPWPIDLGRELTDDVVRQVRHLLIAQFGIEFPKEHVSEACLTLARRRSRFARRST